MLLPDRPGCYQFFNRRGQIIYIGKAVNLKKRVFSYWQKNSQLTPAKQRMVGEIARVKWIEVDSGIEALLLEANLIKKHQPFYNIEQRDDKRFVYINVSLNDEAPGVFVTRRLAKSGKYFGPFVNSLAARETVKTLRKIWPFCLERRVGWRPCFYYQIGRCAGVCGGKISPAAYRRQVIRPIVLFLEGKKTQIISKLRVSISRLEQKVRSKNNSAEDSEELLKLKGRLKNMQEVLTNARVLSVGEKYAADVTELAKILSLPRAPERIEGYDLSNIFGQAAVGSLAVFRNGEPDKNEYRKFKIKASAGSVKRGDTHMLTEILARRLRHSVATNPSAAALSISPHHPTRSKSGEDIWPWPDLIIVDGGKAQLNAAVKVLRRFKADIPILAVSKGEGLRSAAAPDKIFFPEQKEPLSLPLNSPALHLIKRVRDEAHRFAIGYHRSLRRRKFLNS